MQARTGGQEAEKTCTGTPGGRKLEFKGRCTSGGGTTRCVHGGPPTQCLPSSCLSLGDWAAATSYPVN